MAIFQVKPQTVFLILGLLALPLLILGVHHAIAAPLPEGFPSPTSAGQIEIKHYPAYRAGTIAYEGRLSAATAAAFDPLYRHISANDIAMTAPVETRYPLVTLQTDPTQPEEQGRAEVSFLYRNRQIQPQTVAPEIQIQDYPPMTVVSIGVQGPYSYRRYQENVVRLRQWLEQHPQYRIAGSPRQFFYDSPFVPDAFKRSEVQIPVDF